MLVSLDTGATTTLSTISGMTLYGTYTVLADQNSSHLTVSSIDSASVKDVGNHINTSTSMAGLQSNIADTSAIQIDTIVLIDGCTDGDADNYDPTANHDDGSCSYSTPTITSFTSNTTNGTYGIGSSINITARFNKALGGGSTMIVTLDTGAAITLSVIASSTLSGTYTVGSDENSSDLTVSSIDSASISNLHGDIETIYSVPNSNNIATTSALVIDTTAPSFVSASISEGTSIIYLTYDEDLYSPGLSSTPYTVYVDSGSGPVSADITSVAISGKNVLVTLSDPVAITDTVTVDYNAPGSNYVGDAIGNKSESFSGESVSIVPLPHLVSYTSTSPSGNYNEGQTVHVVATFNNSLSTTSTMVLTLNTGATITLGTVSGSTISGNYVVGSSSESTIDLSVQSVSSASVSDTLGNVVSSYTLSGDNISVGSDISINIISTGSCVIRESNANVDDNSINQYPIGDRLFMVKSTSRITVINTVIDKIVSEIKGFSQLYYISPLGQAMYGKTNGGTAALNVLNTITYASSTIPVTTGNSNSYNIAVVGRYIYSASQDKVSVFNTATGSTVATITVGTAPLYLFSVGNRVYVSNYLSGSISVIDSDPSSVNFNTVRATIPVSTFPESFVYTKNKIYVSGENKLDVIDVDPTSLTYNTVIASTTIGPKGDRKMHLVGDKLYLTTSTPIGVTVVDTNTDLVTKVIPLSDLPLDLYAVGTKLYAMRTNVISVIDTSTDTVVSHIGLGASGLRMTSIFPVGTKLYANLTQGNTFVIDTITDTPISLGSTCLVTPVLTSFTSNTSNGTYTSGQTINITANFDMNLGSGSTMTVCLNSSSTASVVLSTISGSTLSGTYTVGSTDDSPDLSVSSIVSASVKNTGNVADTTYTVPASPNLSYDTDANIGNVKDIIVGSTTYGKISVGSNPYQMVTVGNNIYVANQKDDTVSVVSSNSNAVVATISVGNEPYGVAYNSASKEVYVANIGWNSVSVIDADPLSGTYNTVTHNIIVGSQPYYVTTSGSEMYVTNSESNTVSVINTSTHLVTNTIGVGTYPKGIKALGNNIYVANSMSNTVSVINTSTKVVTNTIQVGSGPRGVGVSGTKVYVANYNDNTVSVINDSNKAVSATVAVGKGPRGVLYLNNFVYVENYQDNTISVINTSNNAVTATVKVGDTPAGMAAVGNDVAVSRFADNAVSILDTTTLALKTSLTADTTAPAISSIATSTTATTATITWTTDEASTSTVNFGTTSSYGTASSSAVSTMSHSFTLLSLTPATTYHYQISSWDASGNLATSSDQTFTTSAAADTTPAPTTSPYASTGGGSSGWSSGPSASIIYASSTTPFTSYPWCPLGYICTPTSGNSNTNSNTTTTLNPVTHYQFFRDLTLGSRGTDVQKLQQYLNEKFFYVSQLGVGSPGKETTFFGSATKSALSRFQKAHSIQPSVGYFGSITRGVVNAGM